MHKRPEMTEYTVFSSRFGFSVSRVNVAADSYLSWLALASENAVGFDAHPLRKRFTSVEKKKKSNQREELKVGEQES